MGKARIGRSLSTPVGSSLTPASVAPKLGSTPTLGVGPEEQLLGIRKANRKLTQPGMLGAKSLAGVPGAAGTFGRPRKLGG